MPLNFFELEKEATVYEDHYGEVYPNDTAAMRGADLRANQLLEDRTEFVGSILLVRSEHRRQIGVFISRPSDELLE